MIIQCFQPSFISNLRVFSKILYLPSWQELPLTNRIYYFSYIIYLVSIRQSCFTSARFDSDSDSRLAIHFRFLFNVQLMWRHSSICRRPILEVDGCSDRFGIYFSSSIVSAASSIIRFFRSATAFCCGVYVYENSCRIHSFCR